jgi:hypothetical protein
MTSARIVKAQIEKTTLGEIAEYIREVHIYLYLCVYTLRRINIYMYIYIYIEKTTLGEIAEYIREVYIYTYI